MSGIPNQSKLQAAIDKLHVFCSIHSLLKTDEELRNSFDNFLVTSPPDSVTADNERIQKDYKALEEISPVLDERAKELIAERDQHEKQIPEADFGNHLYASLKRHPE